MSAGSFKLNPVWSNGLQISLASEKKKKKKKGHQICVVAQTANQPQIKNEPRFEVNSERLSLGPTSVGESVDLSGAVKRESHSIPGAGK